MDLTCYNIIVQNFILYAEGYMDYYLNYPLLENNINEYFDPKNLKMIILIQFEQELNNETTSSDDNINQEDQEKLHNYINTFIIKLKDIYKFDKSINLVKEDIFGILMNSIIQEKNRCMECGIDMGITNPRQLCGKRYCHRAE